MIRKYFISPIGEIILVPIRHILSVIDDPCIFELTKEYIQDCYERCEERIGEEGDAREEILVGLYQVGWIRARYYIRNDQWMLHLDTLDERTKNNLSLFYYNALNGIDGHEYFPYSRAIIYQLVGGTISLEFSELK